MSADGDVAPVPGSPEDRAAKITEGWYHIAVKALPTDSRWSGDHVVVVGMIPVVTAIIAAAIRDAVEAERERCAGVAEGLAAARQREFDEYSDRWDEGAAANLRRLAELIRQGPVPPGGAS